jgi:uncharacterized protein with PIN domain
MSWEQLKQIYKTQKKQLEDEQNKKLTECPECFYPLVKNKKGELLCQFHGVVGHE